MGELARRSNKQHWKGTLRAWEAGEPCKKDWLMKGNFSLRGVAAGPGEEPSTKAPFPWFPSHMQRPLEPVTGGKRKGRAKSREPSQVREEIGDLESRKAKVELHIINGDGRFEELENRLLELVEGMEETREEIQAALNKTTDKLASENEALTIAYAEEISAIREERKGDRNLLWGLEQYVRALSIVEDEKKVDHAPLYLGDSAMVWWRRRLSDMEKGTCSIKTWEEFKKELERHFYPENAADERAKLRRLSQKGTIREYVKEFSKFLLEIPNYRDQEALFSFKDGLQTWVKLEIERRGAQDLATAIAIAESLIKFKNG
ncbi:hypothetical protein GH714_016806 [Hevea brasiliensis]|uniref:Retrotransposon gag domain-containing protein n=1 Tax=Hevea brasiliensis TaxID=3981 RepID=A0A6A6MCV0_HEVBR|nr:hypothetical protein GH714_016806 [Hevea brasiliensis]